MASPPPRPALGALFLVLAIAFAGIAAAAAEAVDSNHGLVVLVLLYTLRRDPALQQVEHLEPVEAEECLTAAVD